MPKAYYNELDSFPAAWLRNLAAAGRITPGVVDERSIVDVAPCDLAGFDRVHTFAGIGGWEVALELAGWPVGAPVWTGSCPCQPFSQAGRRGGEADERHLWPVWFKLIAACRPPIIFGEQVASPDGLRWLDLVHDDLEGAGYSVRAEDRSAAFAGAPHIRQRLWFCAIRGDVLADSGRSGLRSSEQDVRERELHADGRGADGTVANPQRLRSRQGRLDRAHGRSALEPDRHGAVGRLADDDDARRGELRSDGLLDGERPALGRDVDGRGAPRRLGDACLDGDREHARELPGHEGQHEERSEDGHHASVASGAARDPWSDLVWIPCRDGKLRPAPRLGPVELSVLGMDHGVPAGLGRFRSQDGEEGYYLHPLSQGEEGRVGRLRGFGNAIVPQVAASFIRDVMEDIGV